MEKKGVRNQGKTRIGEEECRCKTVRMWGKKKENRREEQMQKEEECAYTHTQKKKKKRREQMQKKEERRYAEQRTAVEKCQCKSKSETRMNNRRTD